MRRFYSLYFLVLLSHNLAAESLSFDVNSIVIKAESTSKEEETVFLFENKSDQAITISQLSAPCICLKTSLKDDLKTYLPGKKGELKVSIHTEGLMGALEKKVIISQKDQDGNISNTVLTVKIEIPEIIKLTPKTLKWFPGETPTPKKIKILINQADPISITEASSSDDNYSTELKMIQPGKEFELTVIPKNTTNKILGILKLTTDSKIPRLAQIQAYAVIMMDDEKTKIQP